MTRLVCWAACPGTDGPHEYQRGHCTHEEPRNQCEFHPRFGECSQECADVMNLMSPAPTFDYDPTGTSYPERAYDPVKVAQFDHLNLGVRMAEIGPCP